MSFDLPDISNCTDPRPMANSHKALTSNGAAPLYAGAAVGAIFFLVVIFFLVMFLLWKRRRAQSKEDALSRDQIESLLERIVTRSEGDEPYSRKGNNVIGLAEIKNQSERGFLGQCFCGTSFSISLFLCF